MNGANLSDDETDVLISHNIEKLVNNLIKHQYFKCATISIQDDYNWYKSMEKYFDESFEDWGGGFLLWTAVTNEIFL